MATVQLIYFDVDTAIDPQFHHGLASLIGALKRCGHEVSLNYLKHADDFVLAIESCKVRNPDVVGLSFTTNQRSHVRALLDKFNFSERLLIAGGIHCSILKEKVFDEFPEIQGICIGEGETAFADLCLKIDQAQNYLNTTGFYFKIGANIIKNDFSCLQDIDSLSLPDYSLFPYKDIISENGYRFSMLISRGCPYDCPYCANHALRESYVNQGHYVRFASPKKAIEIIRNNLLLYPQTKKINFSDDIFTINKTWLAAFCSLYKDQIGLPFSCRTRVDKVNHEIIKALKDAGCDLIGFGIESGNEWLRRRILHKNYSNDVIKNAFKIVRSYDIRIETYNMFGLPFETKEMMRETLGLNMELRPDIGRCYYFFPYPETKIFQLCVNYRLTLEGLDQRSNYFTGPSLKEHFASHRDIKKMFEATQLYLYLRGVTYRLRWPSWIERAVFKLMYFFSGQIYFFFNPGSRNNLLSRFRKFCRRFMSKVLR